MKWIGQHIYDLVSRFRNDVFLEGISTSTETDILVVDSSNKISKRAASGLTSGTATLASTVTVTDSTTATAFPVVFHDESNALLDDTGAFTYNPNTGTLITPNLTVSGITTTINTTNLNVEDKNITLNYNDSSDTSGTADGAGITIQDAVDASNDASLTWTAADDTFEFSHAVEINNGASGGTAALTIDNDDVDQIALQINADNTTAPIASIVGGALTTGTALNVDVNDSLTTSATKYLAHIDYDKSGVTASGQTNETTGLLVTMHDSATNHASGATTMQGVNVTIDAASNQGTIQQVGYEATLTDADTGTSSIGYYSRVEDGGTDFISVSSHNNADYFSIATTANGETTLTTVDADAVLANLNFAIDGRTTFTNSNGMQITNSNGSVRSALILDNDDVDQVALDIDADNTTAHIIDINAQALTHGDAIFIDSNSLGGGSLIDLDVDDAYTASPTVVISGQPQTKLINIDYDKAGVIGNGAERTVNALDIDMTDAATNHANGTVELTGIDIAIDAASTTGVNKQRGVKVTLTDADTGIASGGANSAAFWSQTEDGGTDFFAQSSADEGDYFAMSTTTHGATTLRTVDDDAAAAHITVQADGNVTLDANGSVSLETIDTNFIYFKNGSNLFGYLRPESGNHTSLRLYEMGGDSDTDYFSIEVAGHGATTLTTEDAAATAAHFEIAADGNITLDAAGDIALECGGGDLTCDADTITFSSANADDPQFIIKNTTADNQGARLQLRKDRGAAMVDGDRIGEIDFFGEDASQNTQQYGKIQVQTIETDHGSETSKMEFKVAEYDGNVRTGLLITGKDSDSRIDVDVASGTDSETSIAGDLIVKGDDVTIYNAVNDSNPTLSIGSSATNRFEIKSLYNSGAQTLDQVHFTSYTTSSTSHDGRYLFYVDEVELVKIADNGLFVTGGERLQVQADNATLVALDFTASSATQGGKLRLMSGDGAAMANDHRLGVMTFEGAEDASGNYTVGAQIEAFCEANWSASENGARLVFSTTDGNASTSTVLTLDSDKKATFTGPIACTTRTLAVTSSTDGDANGDVVYFGGTTSMTVGKIYHYKSDGTWELANADAVATADGLLGVALGAASDTNGMLLRGMVTLDHDPGAIGDVLYVQSDNAGTPGNATATAPSASGDCVRVIGYQVSHASNGNIWFNPDGTFVEVA